MHFTAMQNILVIDDKAELRSIIAATLTYAGYEVREAANGREGIVMVLAEKPDLILCDVRMPEMDGYRSWPPFADFVAPPPSLSFSCPARWSGMSSATPWLAAPMITF